MPSLPVVLLSWQGAPRNSLCGFATVQFGRYLIIHRVVVHCSHGKSWIQLPSREWLDKSTGKSGYAPAIEFNDKQFADEFRDAVLEVVEAEHPGATKNQWGQR